MKYQVRWPRISLLSAAGLLVLLWAFAAAAQVKVTTVVGGFINDGKPGTSSALQDPTDVAMDSTGNLYITDNIDQRRFLQQPRPQSEGRRDLDRSR